MTSKAVGVEGYPDIKFVKETETTTVECKVEGGYPPNSDEDLKCSDLTFINSDKSSGKITRSKASDCTCKAEHASGCYDKESSLTVTAACELCYLPCS